MSSLEALSLKKAKILNKPHKSLLTTKDVTYYWRLILWFSLFGSEKNTIIFDKFIIVKNLEILLLLYLKL